MVKPSKAYIEYMSAIIPHIAYQGEMKQEDMVSSVVLQMLNRTQAMFKWSGLPDTIPQRFLELYLQVNGNVCFTKVNGDFYVFTGGLGGEPDVYYQPTIYTVANPALRYSANLSIGSECVVVRNDTLYQGIMPILYRYVPLTITAETTLKVALINMRIPSLISASDEATKESAELYMDKIVRGDLSIIVENTFTEGLKTSPYSSTVSHTQEIVEALQYAKACLYQELGLNSNFNMKRERLNEAELQTNDDPLHPLIDEMLKCRQEACDEINALYGLNLSVELASTWAESEEALHGTAQDAVDGDESAPQDAVGGEESAPQDAMTGRQDEVASNEDVQEMQEEPSAMPDEGDTPISDDGEVISDMADDGAEDAVGVTLEDETQGVTVNVNIELDMNASAPTEEQDNQADEKDGDVEDDGNKDSE